MRACVRACVQTLVAGGRLASEIGVKWEVGLKIDFEVDGINTNYATLHIICVGRDSIPVRRPDSHSREPGFKSHCGRFEPLASLITPRCHSSLSCINEYLAIQTVMDMQ